MHPAMRLAFETTSASTAAASRRQVLLAALAAPLGAGAASPARALPQRALQFPADLGSHPEVATEWWYCTGQLNAGSGSKAEVFGFQITFFRARVAATQALESAFAAKQLVFAHAAVTDVRKQKLWHDQRIARAGFGVAYAATHDTDVKLRDWSLKRQPGAWAAPYQAVARGANFAFDLALTPTQPLLLQGEQGLSRKGPQPDQASYYYSVPQLQVKGQLRLGSQLLPVQGSAWLDHEWSQALMHPQAVGWDWLGMNLLDGSALTVFQMRDASGQALWGGGSFRSANPGATPQVFAADQVQFTPLRWWTSPSSQTRYPVAWRVRTPAGVFSVQAAVDNQELDSRLSTGAIYWEGLSDLLDSEGRLVGRGYLEMTGYASALRLNS